MNVILIITVFLAIFKFSACSNQSMVLVAEEGKYKDYTYTVPFDLPGKDKKETLADLGIIYEGMPIADLPLYGFRKKDLIKSYKSDGKKYLVFPKKNEAEKVIIFVIEENKIIDWFPEGLGIIK